MKKIFTYISILMAGLAVSCIQNVEPEATDYALSFEAQVTDLETRSEGENAYHENDIQTMDWFFFSDEAGTTPLYHVTTNSKTLDLTHEQVVANGLTGQSFLYAVANAPEGVAAKTTLADILNTSVSTEYTKTETDDEGNNAQKLDKDHLRFVMDTYDKTTGKYVKEITPQQVNDGVTGSKQEKITVPLSRLAVKFSVKVRIKKEVTTTDSFGNEENWTPVLTQTDFDAYFLNALKAGKMDGVPVRRADEGVDQSKYFDYGRNLATVEQLEGETDYWVWQNVDPFYTFPQKWNDTDNKEPYIKIIFPWMSDVKGSSEFHYKVVLPKPTDHVFTLERNCWYQLTATIAVLGGTENDYVLIDNVQVSVADWAEPSWLIGSGLNSAKFFYVPTKEFDVYSLDSFDIPINTNSSAKAYIRKISFSDYSKTPTNNLVFSKTSIIGTNATSVPASTIKRNGGDDNGKQFSGTENNYSVVVNSTDRYDKYVTFNHSLTGIYVQRDIEIYIEHSERSDWHETVIIHQHPAIEVKKQGAGDVFVNGHFARVSNAGFGESFTQNRVTYWHSRNGWDSSNGGGVYNYNNTRGTYQYGKVTTGGNNDASISSEYYTTDITVTAFNTSNNHYSANNEDVYYKIGDPRVKASTHYTNWSLDPYLTGEQRNGNTNNYNDVTSNWTNAGNVLICSQATNDRPMIAPHFLVSSALNANPGLSWDVVVKRAATYQEAGYPAGRWRLPTEAEMAFIVARQQDGTVPNLYATGTAYWSGSGRVLSNTSSTNLTFRNRTNSDNLSVRFVYDLWYWGTEQESLNVYHGNGHIE